IVQTGTGSCSGDTAPDSWEQEDDVEATIDGQLESAFTTLNVNAKPFVPNVNAAEFVPAFGLKAHPANVDSAGEYRGTTGLHMPTASTSIYERIDHSQELGELQCGRMCNKSSQEISALETINQSPVNGGMFSERTNHASPSV
uniref:Uncharacterized protein n=1 Tax=Neolamprologus brichardi TaxID=32507 RepID=A0A3Q4H6X8_NEOBR